MRRLIKATIILGCMISGSFAEYGSQYAIPQAPQYTYPQEKLSSRIQPNNDYQAKSSGGISMDFVKRFGKHCTSHKNLVGRHVEGLCDSKSLCTDAKQYKACYDNCIVKRKKVDEKTDKILYNLAMCQTPQVDKVRENSDIKQQAIRRLNDKAKTQIKTKTVDTAADHYTAEKSKSILPSLDHVKRLGAHCTSHKNRLGFNVKGICDSNDSCSPAKYKQCYKECVQDRHADEKTPYILSNLSKCRVNFQDRELGPIARDVYTKYQAYEMQYAHSQRMMPRSAR